MVMTPPSMQAVFNAVHSLSMLGTYQRRRNSQPNLGPNILESPIVQETVTRYYNNLIFGIHLKKQGSKQEADGNTDPDEGVELRTRGGRGSNKYEWALSLAVPTPLESTCGSSLTPGAWQGKESTADLYGSISDLLFVTACCS